MSVRPGDDYGGRGIVIPAKTGPGTATVIWLHGLGDTAEGWADAIPVIAAQGCQHFKFILPTADTMPVAIAGPVPIPAWFNIYALSPKNEDQESTLKPIDRVMKIVRGEIAAGIAAERIVIGGFSQGGAVALTAMMRADVKLGAFVAASSWLPLSRSYPAEQSPTNRGSPLLMCHGNYDDVVSLTWAQESADLLKNGLLESGKLAFETYPMRHSACPEELTEIASFIAANVPAI